MAKKNISIYITGEVIRLCEIEKSGNSLTVSRVFETATPAHSVEDGLITDIDSVAEAIRQIFHENNIKKTPIIFTIYSRKIATKEIELPYVKQPAKIQEMINSNVEDYFPMGNMEDYITRFTILDKVEVENRKFYRISVVAVQKELVISYRDLGKALHIPVVSVDYQNNSLYNLMKKQVKQGIALMLQIDDDSTNVTIMNGQAQLFRRSIPYGRDSLVQAAAALLNMDEEGAASVLQDARLLEENITPEDYMELLHELSQAITRVVEFYTTKNPIVIETAKLYGVGAELKGLSDALGGILEVEIEIIREFNGVTVRKDKKLRQNKPLQLAAYLPNIGALIQPLDLKIEEDTVKKTGIGFGFLFGLLGLAVVTAGAICVFYTYENMQLNKDKTAEQAMIDQLQPAEVLYNEYIRAQERYGIISAYDGGNFSDNEALHTLLTDLENIMPEGMGISSLTAGNGSISMSLTGPGKPSVAFMIMALKELPYVSGVRTNSVRDSFSEDGRIISDFNLTFQISRQAELEYQQPGPDGLENVIDDSSRGTEGGAPNESNQ